MADITIPQLGSITSIAAADLLHIIDTSDSDADKKTTVQALTDWISANGNIKVTGIDDVPGLRAALDGKADIVHTHTVGQVIGLQADLDNKTDLSQAQIIGRNIILNGNSINVPSTIGGLQDDRIPSTVVVGEYLQFGTIGGGVNNITGDTLKGNLSLNLVDNTTDIAKPVSTLQQTALDTKVNTTTYTTGQAAQDTNITTNAADITTNASAIALNTTAIATNTSKVSFDSAASTKLAGIEVGADKTDKPNTFDALGISTVGDTDKYLNEQGVFNNFFTDRNTWTQTNTFSDTAIFSNVHNTNGSMQVANRIVHLGDNTTYLQFSTGGMRLSANNVAFLDYFDSSGRFTINAAYNDMDIRINKSSGNAQVLSYDSGTDVLDIDASVINMNASSNSSLHLGILSGTTTIVNGLLTVIRCAGGEGLIQGDSMGTQINYGYHDRDFEIRKLTSGVALSYDAGTDTLTAGAANVSGFGGGGDGGAADSIVRQPNGSTTDPMKVWTGTKAQYDALTPDADTLYSTTDENQATGVSLADNNDWTGVQTFSNTAGIQVENIVGATDMHISANGTEFITHDDSLGVDALQIDGNFVLVNATSGYGFYIGGILGTDEILSLNTSGVITNGGNLDRDFRVGKMTSGVALDFNAGTDTLSTEAANLVGFAGSETGTWTPTFSFAGTQGATTATYSRVGNTVVASCEAVLAAGGIAFNFAVTTASLPFTTSATSLSVGTFFNAATGAVTSPVEGGTVIIVGTDLRFFDKGSTTNVKGTDLLGYISFTITYQTS